MHALILYALDIDLHPLSWSQLKIAKAEESFILIRSGISIC